MPCVLHTPRATQDLVDIGRYLVQESQSRNVAKRFLDFIATKCSVYATAPEIGELCVDLAPNVRRFAVGNYVVFYRPVRGGIEVLRVLHGSRDIPAAWGSR